MSPGLSRGIILTRHLSKFEQMTSYKHIHRLDIEYVVVVKKITYYMIFNILYLKLHINDSGNYFL